jgi:S1-C subfamily serine protease
MHRPPLILLAALLPSLSIPAQEIQQQTLDPETNVLMLEIGAITGVDGDGQVVMESILPRQAVPEENRGADVRKGDRVLMMNGQRVRSSGGLRELYEGVENGGEVKLALEREGRRFLVSFAKSDADSVEHAGAGGRTAVRVVRGGPGGDVELFHEVRALLREDGDKVRVDMLFGDGGTLEQGDVVQTVNGTAVASLAGYREAYGAVEMGADLTLGIRRGEETLEIAVAKSERPEGMMIRRSQ